MPKRSGLPSAAAGDPPATSQRKGKSNFTLSVSRAAVEAVAAKVKRKPADALSHLQAGVPDLLERAADELRQEWIKDLQAQLAEAQASAPNKATVPAQD